MSRLSRSASAGGPLGGPGLRPRIGGLAHPATAVRVRQAAAVVVDVLLEAEAALGVALFPDLPDDARQQSAAVFRGGVAKSPRAGGQAEFAHGALCAAGVAAAI